MKAALLRYYKREQWRRFYVFLLRTLFSGGGQKYED